MIAHAHNMNGRMAEWQNGRIEEWQDGRMEEWKIGRMAGWQNGMALLGHRSMLCNFSLEFTLFFTYAVYPNFSSAAAQWDWSERLSGMDSKYRLFFISGILMMI